MKVNLSQQGLTPQQLFSYLNLWDVDPKLKADYIRDFKKYLNLKTITMEQIKSQNKQKTKFNVFFKYINEQIEKESKKPVFSKQHYNLPVEKDHNDEYRLNNPNKPIELSSDCEDIIVLTHLYNKLVDQYSENPVTGNHLYMSLVGNVQICNLFRIDPNHFKNQNTITQKSFLEQVLNASIYLPDKPSQSVQVYIPNQQNIDDVSQSFDFVNRSQAKSVEVRNLLETFKIHPDVLNIINEPIIQVESINKPISLKRQLYELQLVHLYQNLKRITKQEFLDFITSYSHREIPKYDSILVSNSIDQQQKLNLSFTKQDQIGLTTQSLTTLRSAFNQCNKEYGLFVHLSEFINQLKHHENYDNISQEVVKKSIQGLAVTIEDILDQNYNNQSQYYIYDEIVCLFTLNGKNSWEIVYQKYLPPPAMSKETEKIINKKFGAYSKIDSDNYYITIPKALDIDQSNEHKTCIQEQKLQEMVLQKNLQQQNELNYQFKARDVPKSVRESRYQQINQQKQDRRNSLLQESLERNASNKAFADHPERSSSKKKTHTYPYENYKFTALEVPASSKMLLYDQMLEEKKMQSQINVLKRKAEIMDDSGLPSEAKSFQLRQKIMEDERQLKQTNQQRQFQQFKALPMPDLLAQQKKFQNDFYEKKHKIPGTIPQQPNLHEVKNHSHLGFLDEENRHNEHHYQSRIEQIDDSLHRINNQSFFAQSQISQNTSYMQH